MTALQPDHTSHAEAVSDSEPMYQIDLPAEMALKLFTALAETERICDWARSGDTSRAEAGPKLYDLWVKVYG